MARRLSTRPPVTYPLAETLYALACAVTEAEDGSPVRRLLAERFQCALNEDHLRFLLREPGVTVRVAPGGDRAEIRMDADLADSRARRRRLNAIAASILEMEDYA